MNWQPHLKIRITDGIEMHQHNFMSSGQNIDEQIKIVNRLKSYFKKEEKLILSIGY